MRRLGHLLAVVATAGLAAGCLVDVSHVADPGPAFAEAHRQAAAVQGSVGPPETLNILVFDPDEKELVRVRVPMWMARMGDNAEADVELDHETREHIRRHAGRDLRFEDLEKAGLGILVEVNEDGGERVLIWLS
jgi:hypothetical protein